MSQLPNQTRSTTLCPPYTTIDTQQQTFNTFGSPRIATTTLIGPPVSNISKKLRANESNSPKLSPIDNALFGYPSTPAHSTYLGGGASTSSNPPTPELSPSMSLISPTHSSVPSTPDRAMYAMNHTPFRQMQPWDASSSHSDAYSSNPPSPMSLSPAMGRMSLNAHQQQPMGLMPMHHTSPHSMTMPEPPATPQKKIPRPPNAFMLFRSHFLKTGQVPPTAERKQQTLSSLTGQIWNMMQPDEKKQWHEKAAEVLAEHARKNPGYKFNPSPKGTKKKGGSAGSAGGREKEDESAKAERVRELREKYTNFHGPSPVSSRKRKGKKAHSVDDGKPMGSSTGSSGGKRAKSHDADERNAFGGAGAGRATVFAQPTALVAPGVISFANYNLAAAMGQQQQHAYHPVHPSPLRNTAIPRRPSTSMGFSEKHSGLMFPMPDTRDMRISAARSASGQQVPMQVNGMIHETAFINRFQNAADMLADMFPYGLQVPATSMQNLTSSVSEPSSSPTQRYSHMYDPENPFAPKDSNANDMAASSSPVPTTPTTASTSTSTSNGGRDFSNFNYNGQNYNLSKVITVPPPRSPNAMDASPPPSAGVAPSNTLTIDVEYPASLGPHLSAVAGQSGSGNVGEGEGWIYSAMEVEMGHFDGGNCGWTYEEGEMNVSMGSSV
ncbi:hypothetical protein BJ165DRAFT_1521431 [Panaeolus papilionaceus]|nr:hypothetical protein BJ165DRAFT_1521431 [Panaeolus papilionaceus]